MKYYLFFFLAPLLVFSQATNDRIIYLDSLEQLANEDNYHILRIMKDYYTDNPGCMVYDYYKSGNKKLIGNFKDKYNLLKSGEFIAFYENGNKASIFHFENNVPIGKFYTWYEKGNIKSEGEFLKFKNEKKPVLKVHQYWSRIGIHRVVNGNGKYEDDDTTWYSEGELKNGFQEGEWVGYDIVDKTNFTERYKAGVLISGVSTDSIKRNYKYNELYEDAEPKQNRDQFYRHLKNNLKIPAYILNNKLSGKIELSFIVNKEGWVTKTKIIKGMGYGLDEEVIRIIRNWDQWSPAKKRGVPFEREFTIPIYIYKGAL